ncbi:MAG: hypothetical protein H0W64_01760 [Gammaproteobacteria bacterium]|nr:hypothetical protein [Gammaproteobacteria bacterium]
MNNRNNDALPPVEKAGCVVGNSTNFWVNCGRAGASTVGISFVNALGGYFPEAWMNRTATNAVSMKDFFKDLKRNPEVVSNGLKASCRVSLIKNAALANHSRIAEMVEGYMGTKQNPRVPNEYIKTGATVGAITTLDILSGQYFINQKILWDTQNKRPPKNNPYNGAFYRTGLTTRWASNGFTVFLCIGSQGVIKKQTDQFLPPEQYGFASNAAATVLSGMIAGLGGYSARVVNTNRVSQFNFDQGKAPSIPTVIKNLHAHNGLKVFYRGAGITMPLTVFYFGTMNGLNYGFDALWNYIDSGELSRKKQQGMETLKQWVGNIASNASPEAVPPITESSESKPKVPLERESAHQPSLFNSKNPNYLAYRRHFETTKKLINPLNFFASYFNHPTETAQQQTVVSGLKRGK